MNKTFEKGKLQKILRWLCLCFALVMVLFAAFPTEAFADSLTSVKNLGTTGATDIAATQDGKLLYVTESSSSPIYIMNVDGSNQTTLGSQTFMFPKYLFVDHNSNIFVLDFQSTSWNSARITKLNSSGSIIWQSNYLDITNYSIMDVAAFDNYVYLVDTSYKVLRIYSYNGSTGNLDYVNGIGGMFAGDEPYYPNGVTVRWNPGTSSNEVYFTDVQRDITNGRTHGVFKMDATGGSLTEVNKNVGDISPDQIAVDSVGNVYFVDGGSGINKIDAITKVHSYLLSAPHSASDITVGPSGQVYVTCYNTSVTPTIYDITRLALTPVVSSLSVSSGPVTGGTSVTINGSGFTGATAVTFGGAAALSFTINSDTSITATAPARSGGTLGTVNVIVTAPGGTSSASSSQFTYTPGPAVSLTVSASGNQTAGTAFSVVVTAKDQYGNTATGYEGTVRFSTNNGNSPNGTAPSLPGNYTFTAGDAGTHNFNNAVLYNKTSSTISAADTVTGSISGVTGTITVNAGAVSDSNSSVTAQNEFVLANNADNTTITVTLKDSYKNPINGKTVELGKGTGSATISPASTVSNSSGSAVFITRNTKAETVTYTVNVDYTSTSLTSQVTFTPGAAASLQVSAVATQTAGIPFPVTITAKDQYGNTATGYTGTVRLTSDNGTSPNGTVPVLPADYAFKGTDAGAHTFTDVILYNKTASEMISADTATGSISGSTGIITVNAGAVNENNSTAAAVKTSVTADNVDSTIISVTLKDTYNNPVNGKTVSLAKNGGSSTISPDSAVSGADGSADFTVKNTKTDTTVYTVSVNGSATDLTRQITFTPGAAVNLTISAGGIQKAGTAFTVTVAAIDQNGNIATGYTGTVHFTTTNGNSPGGNAPSLPQDYTFTTADKGIHTFSTDFSLSNAAASTLTVSDRDNAAITKTTGVIDVSPGNVDPDESSAVTIDDEVIANDSDFAVITVTLKDHYSNPVSGKNVALDKVSGNAEIATANDISDAAGIVTFTVKSRKAEEITFAASGGVEIDQKVVITFLPGPVKSFKVETDSTQQAGVWFDVTVTAQDEFENIVTNYNGTISFSTNNGNSPDGVGPELHEDYTFTAGDGGSHMFVSGAALYNAAASALTVTDSEDEENISSGSSPGITVQPGPVDAENSSVETSDLEITADGDDSAVITVKLRDDFGNPVIGEEVTLKKGSSSSVITTADQDSDATGTVFFSVKNAKAEVVDYTAEAEGISITQTVQVTFVHGKANGLDLSILNDSGGPRSAGEPFGIVVTVKDEDGNTVTDYTETISFSTNNGASPDGTNPSLPSDYTFTLQDEGSHAFAGGVTLYNATTCGLTVSGDVYQVRDDTTKTITVIHGVVNMNKSKVEVDASASKIIANNTDSSTITVALEDAYGNPVPNMPVTLEQNGSSILLPAGALSDNDGIAEFTVKSTVAEKVNYTAKVNGSYLSQTALVEFMPGQAEVLKVIALEATPKAGSSFDITVTALDHYENIAEGYMGTIRFSTDNGKSPDGAKDPSLPADYTFTEDDGGVHIFSSGATLYNAVESKCTVTDTLDISITATTGKITVAPGTADAEKSALTRSKSAAIADNLDSITITAVIKDAYGNLVSGKTITLNKGSGSSNISPPTRTSGADGSAEFTVNSTKAEAVTYTASAEGIIITQTAPVAFLAGPADAAHSTVAKGKSVVTNDGTDSTELTVTLFDAFDNPVSGKTVTLSQGGGNSVITSMGAVTGVSGTAVFTVTNTTAENVTYTASVNGIAVSQTTTVSFLPKHTVTVSAIPAPGGAVSGGGVYHEGTQVTVTVSANSRYRFTSWTEGSVVVSTSTAITFTMGMADKTLVANFSAINSGGGKPDEPAAPNYQASLSGTGVAGTTLPTTVDKEKGRAEINLGDMTGDVLKGKGTGVVTVPPISGVNAYTLSIPATSLSGTEDDSELTFKTVKGSITIPENMLSGMAGVDGKGAGITIGEGDKSNLPDEVKEALGNRPVVQLTLTLNGTQSNWNNPDTPVVVSVPYSPTTAELSDPEHIVVWYLDGSGNAVNIPSGKYDQATGLVTFSTTHFSRYAIAYVHKTFRDLTGYNWAKKPIEVMASKGIVNGTGGNAYSPGNNITRADYLLMLVHTLGLSADFDSNFKDVGQDAYYYEASGIAKKLGIVTGSGDNKFDPKEKISRQDMMAMTARALENYRGLKAADDESALLGQFSDRGDIAGYAAKSMAALVKEGLITGSMGKINPRASTTRAEATVFLYRIYNNY